MAFHFLQLPARGCEQSEEELNSFLRSHRVLAIDRRWVDQGENSFWAICIDYLDAPNRKEGGGTASSAGRNRVDYRQILSPEQFTQFVALRDLRKEIAGEDSVPVYAVMTNEQLAQVVQREVTDKSALLAIPGLGEAKVEKYGQRVLDFLKQDGATSDATSGKPV
jgi:superfamily II DNA helicase RecQ